MIKIPFAKAIRFFTSATVTASVLFIYQPSAVASQQDPQGFYLSARGAVDAGGTSYLGVSDSLTGWNVEASLGWRASSLIKWGLMGVYENLILANSGGSIGPMNMIGGGAMVRLFFVPAIFIEADGGLTQANLYTSSTATALIAGGTFETIGPGLEFSLNENVTAELSLRIRNVTFSQQQFSNMNSVFYSAGITAYFR